MRTNFYIILLVQIKIITITCVIITSCDKENDLGKSNFVMVTGRSNDISFDIAGTGTFEIDWGDGSGPETHTILDYNEEDWKPYSPYGYGGEPLEPKTFRHIYSGISTHVISITGNNITHFNCTRNELTGLSVNKNTPLLNLRCWGNPLNSLDVSALIMLTTLNCGSNNLKQLNVSKNTALSYLFCDDNKIKSLDVSNNTELTYLNCRNNKLTSLDVRKNTKLDSLFCGRNSLTELDISNNTALTLLDCGFAQLKILDVSNQTALKDLVCSNNQLTSLDMRKNTALIHLDCQANQLTAQALNNLFETLNDNEQNEKSIVIYNNPGNASCDRSIAENKGWKVYFN